MYVYIEEVFLVNFLADYIICHFVCRLKSCGKRTSRCALCAFTGAAYAVLSIYINFGIAGKIIVCIIMGAILDSSGPHETVVASVYILTGSFICAGGSIAFTYIFNSDDMISPVKLNYTVLFSGIAVALFVFDKCMRPMTADMEIGKKIISGEIYFSGNTVSVSLFNDSGNLLRTNNGSSIVIVDYSVSEKLLKGICENIFPSYTDSSITQNPPPELYGKTGIVYANTISGKSTLFTLRADSMMLLYSDEIIEINPVYLAFTEIKDNRFCGIVNCGLITKEVKK